MTTTADRLRSFWGERQLDRERLTSLAVRYWQIGLIVTLMGLAAGLRLWDLGERAIHHDESIHIKFAYDITKSGVDQYTHDPVYHGPFQYFAIASSFVLFGDSDYTSRLAPALFGTVLVGLPFLLRRQMGMLGAFVAAGLIAVSPTLLYVSRFAREDMYAVAFTLAMVVAIWRYLAEARAAGTAESPAFPLTGAVFRDQLVEFWSYVTQRQHLWLIVIGPLLAFSFAAKEVTFITVAILLIFLNFMVAWDLVDQIRASRKLSPVQTALTYVLIVPTAWAIVGLWPLIEGLRKEFSLTRMPAAGPLLIVFGTLAGPQYAAGAQKLPFIDDNGYMAEGGVMRTTVILLILAGAYVGLLWNWRVWLAAGLLLYLPFVLLFTSFFTNMGGFWTGIWGSMDYWLSQQLVRRGNQPDYYYFMLLPVYEFLPLVFALGGALYYGFRGRLEQRLLSASALLLVLVFSMIPESTRVLGGAHIQISFIIAIAAVLLLSMDMLTKFLLFWTLSILFSLTVAGEKMPWLSAHLALPVALLAARVFADIMSTVGGQARDEAVAEGAPSPPARQKAVETVTTLGGLVPGWLVPLVSAGFLGLAAALLFQAVGPGSAPSVLAWLLSLGALGIVAWVGSRISWRLAGQTAAVALFAALLVFTVRAGATAAFDQGDPDGSPPELLIYAQGSPKLGILADEIDRLARTSGQGRDLKIYIDNTGNIWPWPWYLREYRNVEYTTFDAGFAPPAGSVVLIGQQNQSKMQPFLDQYREAIPYTHMWWFPEFYRGLHADDFLADFFSGRYVSTWRGYFIDRIVPGAVAGADLFAYFPKDFASTVPVVVTPGTATAEFLPPEAQTDIGAPGSDEGQFNQPADLAIDGEGNLYVVDSLNHRIQKIAPDGTVTTVGEPGSDPGEFANPRDQSADFAADGPWGIGVDDEGNVYVADTWNHRIQKFGPDLQFIMEWGVGELFGPRDVALHPDGNVLVVDTGNKRVVKYDREGRLVAVYGKGGGGKTEFNEPSSISVTATGDIYVADYWNQRIQHFDAQFQFIDEIKVPSWGSHGITDRAYIAALADDRVLATDPANGRIAVFSASGEEEASWKLSDIGTTRPVGIVVDSEDRVYIADAVASKVVRVALQALLVAQAAPAP